MLQDSDVMQGNSRIMQRDSHTMRGISILALFFLPITAVSSIFGTQFFSTVEVKEDNRDPTENPFTDLNGKFWILWAIAGPLTVVIGVLWLLWERKVRSTYIN